ncbi:Uncharacterised protein [Chlamydia trachomatis]|nr:Uncharacterised protein [Chlamydia trachomatis]
MHEQYRRVLYSATIVTYRGGEGKPSCTHHTSHIHMVDSRVVPRSFVVGSRVLSYIVARLLSAGVGAC